MLCRYSDTSVLIAFQFFRCGMLFLYGVSVEVRKLSYSAGVN